MLKKNDEIILTIDCLGAEGEGIATHEGKVVFVPFALPGEEVLAHIIYDKKSFYVSKLKKIITPSPARVEAPCPYFSQCGGCDIQHMDYASQLIYKRELVFSTIKKYTGVQAEVGEVVPSNMTLRYRNKFAFPVQSDESGRIVIGMYKKHSHDLIPIHDCLLQSERAREVVLLVKKFMEENKVSAYSSETGEGLVKHIVMRESESGFILTVVVTQDDGTDFSPLFELLSEKFDNFGLFKNVNKLNNNVIFGNLDIFLHGESALEKREFGIDYFVSNRSFMQVNDEIKDLIYTEVLNEIDEDETVVDAYSGAGLLSAIMAKKSKLVYAVEIEPEAVKNADALKEYNKIENLITICGDCAKRLPELSKTLGEFVLVLDPPRKGVHEAVLESIVLSQPKKVIYISCNPATLARDLKLLLKEYEIKKIIPFDMFPQTANVETLTVLLKKD